MIPLDTLPGICHFKISNNIYIISSLFLITNNIIKGVSSMYRYLTEKLIWNLTKTKTTYYNRLIIMYPVEIFDKALEV